MHIVFMSYILLLFKFVLKIVLCILSVKYFFMIVEDASIKKKNLTNLCTRNIEYVLTFLILFYY